jgi:hypothetical protein
MCNHAYEKRACGIRGRQGSRDKKSGVMSPSAKIDSQVEIAKNGEKKAPYIEMNQKVGE